jgi:AraC-like DNA-binding protein
LTIEKAQQEEFYRRRMNFYVKALHEFMTPLTLMSEMVHNLHNKVRPSLQSTLFMLTNQTDRLIEVLNTIIDTKEEMSAHEILQKAKEMTQVDRDFLYRCTESVNKHLADVEYSHQIMMQEVGASHATLYRKLKAMTGMDATTYIRSIRMRAACQILANEPNIRINELAERVGYSNPRYFSTCFKKEFGVTPREYNNEQPAK